MEKMKLNDDKITGIKEKKKLQITSSSIASFAGDKIARNKLANLEKEN